jgi:hypothetical protein
MAYRCAGYSARVYPVFFCIAGNGRLFTAWRVFNFNNGMFVIIAAAMVPIAGSA